MLLVRRNNLIPPLVRVKPGALDRMGIYAERYQFNRILLFFSQDLDDHLLKRLASSLFSRNIDIVQQTPVASISFEEATEIFRGLPRNVDAIIGFGGGKALDVAKYISFLGRIPYISVPTSLSNDGFCSSQSSLTVGDRRQTLPSAMPFGVVLDTGVCLKAPEILWFSGIGDLISKLTAVTDWKMAFHAKGTQVDDFAALICDASVYQFLARPTRDLEGIKLLGTALLFNGIAMSICGSSRPASGSEHLISHALDSLSKRPRLHGLQVGVATYLISLLQHQHSENIAALFNATGFWRAISNDPFDRSEWLEAATLAPSLKSDFYTVLSSRDCLPEIQNALDSDAYLRPCFSA
ncbi:MAG: iron-containing alcohol dehydrogenase family protein [Verrucomicrobia bacterium]|nr:iron-containing alcohol dehydrogenase family protein [Verrucomicrobiota bacterium]